MSSWSKHVADLEYLRLEHCSSERGGTILYSVSGVKWLDGITEEADVICTWWVNGGKQ